MQLHVESAEINLAEVSDPKRRNWKSIDVEKFLGFVSSNLSEKRWMRMPGEPSPNDIDNAVNHLLDRPAGTAGINTLGKAINMVPPRMDPPSAQRQSRRHTGDIDYISAHITMKTRRSTRQRGMRKER